jgi:hypothetical protein
VNGLWLMIDHQPFFLLFQTAGRIVLGLESYRGTPFLQSTFTHGLACATLRDGP